MTISLDQDETWSRDDIEDGVCDILAQVLERPAGSVGAGMPLDEGLGVDSLALIQAQVGIEEHFGVVMPEIEEGTQDGLHTVDDLVRLVAARSQGMSVDG